MTRFLAGLLVVALVCGAFATSLPHPNVQAGQVHKLSGASFKAVVERHEFVLVTFFAPWCKYSRELLATLEQLATTPLSEKLVFASVDITVEQALGAAERISRVPVMKFWRNGALTATMDGAQPADVILPWLTKLMTPIDDLEAPAVLAAEHVLVGFFQNAENRQLTSSTPVDHHTSLFVEVMEKLKQSGRTNIVFAEANNMPRRLAERLGASGAKFPTFGVVSWEKNSRGIVPVTRMWDEDSKVAMTADAVVQWATQCADGKECPEYIKSEPAPDNKPGHLQILTGKTLDASIAQEKDVVVYFGATNTGPFALLDRVAQRLAGIPTVTVGRLDVFHNHVSNELRRKFRGYGLPMLVMFPANDKSKFAVFCNKATFNEENIMQFVAHTASNKFAIPPPLKVSDDPQQGGGSSSSSGSTEVNPYEYATAWGRLMNTIYKWLGIFWIRF